jgi:hypothetical protein
MFPTKFKRQAMNIVAAKLASSIIRFLNYNIFRVFARLKQNTSCYDLVSFYVVIRRYTRPFRYSTISDPPSFELPYTLSTNVIGTCTRAKLR